MLQVVRFEFLKFNTVGVLKFQTLVVSQKGLDKQCRPRLDCFPVNYSDKCFPALTTNILVENSKKKVLEI